MSESQIGRRREAALSGGRGGYIERRKKLIEAAARVFQDKGFGAASLGDVANELGTDRASLYYYVSSKEELFHAVVFQAAEENVLVAEAIRDADLPVSEKLAELIHELMLSYEKHYPYLFVYIQEKMASWNPETDQESSAWADDMIDLNARYAAAVNAVVRQGVEQGVFKQLASTRVISYGIVGMVNWSHRWFRPEGPSSADDISRAYAEIVLKGLLVDPETWHQPADARTRVWLRGVRAADPDDSGEGRPRRKVPAKKASSSTAKKATASTARKATASTARKATASTVKKTRTAATSNGGNAATAKKAAAKSPRKTTRTRS
jgi:AcrR family transcriptional regulator